MDMIQIKATILAGERLASKIKDAFFLDEKWTPKIAFSVGHKMAQLKKLSRPLYETMNEIQFLHELGNYTAQDVLDAFDDTPAKEGLCRENQPSSICALMERSTEKTQR